MPIKNDREADIENLAAEMLEDLERESGIPISEMMAEEIEAEAGEPAQMPEGFESFEVYEEPRDDLPLDLENPDGRDTDEYFDVLFDEIDVPPDTEDAYPIEA